EAEAVELIKPRGMPRGLTIRKLSEPSRTPSLKVEDKTEQKAEITPTSTSTSTSTSPATSPNFSRPRLQATQHLINLCRNSASPPDESTVYPSPDDAPASRAPDEDPTISPCHSFRPSPELRHHQLASPHFTFQIPSNSNNNNNNNKSHIRDPPSIRVDPPRYDPTLLPAYQWADQHHSSAASSRPELPWSWTKRWTCCYCHAQTIVEQGDCASLECGHVRCAGGCAVIRGQQGGELRLY
ncbi:hypothetical protein B0A55_13227, partial [Friedmanniomyces simplex]